MRTATRTANGVAATPCHRGVPCGARRVARNPCRRGLRRSPWPTIASRRCKRFLASGASPDMVDKNGDPVIVIAVRAGSTASLDLLLGARANVNATHQTSAIRADGRRVGRAPGNREEAAGARRRRQASGLERFDLRRDGRPRRGGSLPSRRGRGSECGIAERDDGADDGGARG